MSFVGVIFAIIALDQWSKWMIKTSYKLYQSEPIIEGFLYFTYVTNDGMAFGLSFPGGKTILLIVTLILTGVIMWMLWKEKNSHNLIRYGLTLILAGAIGNFIDRFYLGYVIDFIDWHIGVHHWPTFNVADIFITLGIAIFLMKDMIVKKRCFEKKK